MADSIRQRIILELDYHLSGLTTANGFNTNAGANMERGRKQWEEDDPDCLSYFPQNETSERAQYAAEKITMPFEINILSTYADSDTAGDKGEKILADIRESMHKVTKNPKDALAIDIIYSGGGVDEYPAKSKKIVGVTASFNIIYETRIGDPYSQP